MRRPAVTHHGAGPVRFLAAMFRFTMEWGASFRLALVSARQISWNRRYSGCRRNEWTVKQEYCFSEGGCIQFVPGGDATDFSTRSAALTHDPLSRFTNRLWPGRIRRILVTQKGFKS